MNLELKIGKDTVEVYDGPYTSDRSVTEEGVAFAKHVLAIADDAKNVAADEFLKTYNDAWSGGDNPKLTREQFIKNLVFSSVTLFDEIGAAKIFYKDGDMFGGHWISVFLSKGEPDFASMGG